MIGCSNIVVKNVPARRAVGTVRLAAECLLRPQTGGQCPAVVVGQYSMLSRCITGSSSRSW